MKRIFTLIVLLAIVISVKAQDLTFEQTVSYIQKNITGRLMYPGDLDAYSRIKGYTLKEISIQQNGAIVIQTDQKSDANDFNISFNVFDLVERVDYPGGIRAYKFLIHFSGLNVSKGYGIAFATDADAQRVARAFRHLKKVCIREEDPFSKPAEEEKKPDLSREETIKYINQLLSTQSKIYYKTPTCSYCKGNEYKYKEDEKVTLYNSNALYYSDELKTYYINSSFILTKWIKSNGSFYQNKFPEHKHSEGKSKIKGVITFTEQACSNNVISGNCNWLFIHTNNNGTSETLGVYLSGTDPKAIPRLKKAFTRLNELSSDEQDPFD